MEYELMENNNVFLIRVIKKLWSELAAKQIEMENAACGVAIEFRKRTDEMFHWIDGMSADDIEDMVLKDAKSIIEENNLEAEIIGVVVSGSRCRGMEKAGSDLDIVLEYKGAISEDSFFNILHEDEMEIGGVKVDINPITEGESGTLESYLSAVEEYLRQKQVEIDEDKEIRGSMCGEGDAESLKLGVLS